MSLDDALNGLVQQSRKQKAKSQTKIDQQKRSTNPNADAIKRNMA